MLLNYKSYKIDRCDKIDEAKNLNYVAQNTRAYH